MKDLIHKIRQGLCRFVGEILLEARLVQPEDVTAAIEEQQKTHELLGQILVRKGLLSQQQLVDILELQLTNRLSSSASSPKQLGEILIERGSISRWQLGRALQQQPTRSCRIGQILVELGYVSKGKVEQAVSDQAIGALRQFPSYTRKTLGELLLQANRLTPLQLQEALEEQRQTHEYLGSILMRHGYISEDELEDLLATQLILAANQTQGPSPFNLFKYAQTVPVGGYHWNKQEGFQPLKPPAGLQPVHKKLGEILVETHQISIEQLQSAIQEQKTEYRKLGDILLEKAYLPARELLRALRLQQRMATLALPTMLGLSLLLSACATPIVPIQSTVNTNMSIATASTQLRHSRVLDGPFKTMQLTESQKTMKIFQNGSKVLDEVPFYQQGNDNTCGQAVMTALLNYWGYDISYQQLVDEVNPNNLPTTDDAITNVLRARGLKSQEYRGATIDNLIAQINKGRPTPVLLDFGGLSQEHYVIVVGYNLKNSTLIVHDSLEGPYVELTMTTFYTMWQNNALRNIHVFGGGNYKRLMFDVFR